MVRGQTESRRDLHIVVSYPGLPATIIIVYEPHPPKRVTPAERGGGEVMRCVAQRCPGEMGQHRIVHTLVRGGKLVVVEDLPAWVCPACGYSVLDLEERDGLSAFDPIAGGPVRHPAACRLTQAPTV